MSWESGTFSFSNTLNVSRQQPLDARQVAKNISNLTSAEIPAKFKGMIVSVTNDEDRSGGSTDNNGLYILTGTDSTQLSSWTKVGSLPDTTGNAGKVLSVNSSADGYELSTIPTELPSATGSDADKVLSVNGSGDYVLSTLSIPTNTNELTNGANFITSSDIPGNATTSSNGLMSFSDKIKLGRININSSNKVNANCIGGGSVTDSNFNRLIGVESKIITANESLFDLANFKFIGRFGGNVQNLNTQNLDIKWDGDITSGTLFDFVSHSDNQAMYTIKKKGLWTINCLIVGSNGATNDRILHYLQLFKYPNTVGDYEDRTQIPYNMGSHYYRDDNNNFDDTVLSGTVTTYFDVGDQFLIRSRYQYAQNTGTNNINASDSFITLEVVY
tara:strand:- start:2048 stop:3208 length:1161 start_codon:yes stop_codon:yes gene_type:complete